MIRSRDLEDSRRKGSSRQFQTLKAANQVLRVVPRSRPKAAKVSGTKMEGNGDGTAVIVGTIRTGISTLMIAQVHLGKTFHTAGYHRLSLHPVPSEMNYGS
jgi:ribosome-interacting GTPase 1